jgi:hypothetical protein
MVLNGRAELIAQTYFSHEEGKGYCIRQKASGLIIGNDATVTDGAKICTLAADDQYQIMSIISTGTTGEFLIKNQNDKFLSRVSNDWSMGFVADNAYIATPSSANNAITISCLDII